ncbi:MAG: class I SAM-dependent methyltransferase [Methanosarcinales archaeon]|nr:MAG: class I SAM-dependent methyltransferase [Methanosarcinales archaeon]
MDKPEPNLNFRIMSLAFGLRDTFLPRKKILDEVRIKPGFSVLDYGCGSGSYITAAAELAGDSGRVYALDIHPLAIKRARRIASRNQLANVKTIQSNCATGLPDNSVDAALLYDVFHKLSDPDSVLMELHRVLTPNGILSFSDHHLTEDAVVSGVTGKGLFKLAEKGTKTYSFSIA